MMKKLDKVTIKRTSPSNFKNKVSASILSIDNSLNDEILLCEHEAKKLNISKSRNHLFKYKLAYLKGLVRARHIVREKICCISPGDIDRKTHAVITDIHNAHYMRGIDAAKGAGDDC